MGAVFKILIVEDDEVIAETLRQRLSSWGYETQTVKDFQDVLGQFVRFSPHLVLLDITLPYFNGYHWCSEIRKVSKVPVLFISSASEPLNIIMTMQLGGDDFVVKPFDLDVLVAKIQALLRRSYDFAGQTELLEHRGAILNRDDATLLCQGQRVELTKNEFRILQVLMENKGKTVSRETLMLRLWKTEDFVDEKTLTVNIARLRKKLEEVGLQDFIVTKKGMGYLVE